MWVAARCPLWAFCHPTPPDPIDVLLVFLEHSKYSRLLEGTSLKRNQNFKISTDLAAPFPDPLTCPHIF
ncbi:hypothetical protein I79_014612 [Cricetulus griseus]|uniref:Uncharacterized protein n=1 Tax=Cricetulus griseus TaxID=10029 RepID=G3HUK0_CRIGR|nr:hypothetical protein I79_014612 [Cricetulus griseus]